jgi:uncharacterized protein (TIGR00255 family)
MPLSSMTGFARSHGTSGVYAWAWEIKSVNAKGLDLRIRTPAGWDAVDVAARARVTEALARGTVYATLTVDRQGVASAIKINEQVLDAVMATLRSLEGKIDATPPSLDGILNLKGVIEISDTDVGEEDRRAAETDIMGGFIEALRQLNDMRKREGATLGQLLAARLTEMAALGKRADAAPGRRPVAIRARLVEQVATLLDASDRFDPDRLHQEAILIATKADVREELDRLASHIGQAEKLIAQGGPVGRRLDFLSQELNREVNTLCAKANDVELTNIGLELKNVVEQFREQVQNLE